MSSESAYRGKGHCSHLRGTSWWIDRSIEDHLMIQTVGGPGALPGFLLWLRFPLSLGYWAWSKVYLIVKLRPFFGLREALCSLWFCLFCQPYLLSVSLAPSSSVLFPISFLFVLSSEQWGLSPLALSASRLVSSKPSSTQQQRDPWHMPLASCPQLLKATGRPPFSPYHRGSHQQQNQSQLFNVPSAFCTQKSPELTLPLRQTQPTLCILSRISSVFKAFLFLRIKPDSTPIPTGLWNYITFFPGHCCLAHLQGYGFHGAAITKGHELGWGEGGLTAMEMHSLPVLEGEVWDQVWADLVPSRGLEGESVSGQSASLWPCHFSPSMWLLICVCLLFCELSHWI